MAIFDYSTRDFDTIRADMLARAAAVFPEWTDRDPSDFGMLMVDLWAHAADVMHYYIDRAAGEAFLSTAQQRESVLAIANLMDYVPRGRSAAQAVVTYTNNTAAYVNVPALSTLTGRYNNKSYSALSTTSASVPPYSSLTAAIREGTLHTEDVLTSSSSGQSGQQYSIATTDVDASTIVVYVYEDGINPVMYTSVPRISLGQQGDRVFSVYTASDLSVKVVFGNAVNGFVPPAGSKITATYVECSGSEGNLPANTIAAFTGVGFTGVTITASSALAGGLDVESIESMKRSIPQTIRSQGRAVTRSDFVSLAIQVPGVAKASISYVPGLSSASAGGASVGTNGSVTVYPQASRSDFLTTTDTSQAVSASLQTLVVNTLQPYALLGVTVLAASTIQWTPIDIRINLFVRDRYVQSTIAQNVSDAIDELFYFDNVIFGQRLHLGQVYAIINSVVGVSYAVVTRFDTSGLTGVQTSILIDPLKLPKKGVYVFTSSGGTT